MDLATTICEKLGITTDELNSLYTTCPVNGAVGAVVSEEIAERFGLGPDCDDLAGALQARSILTAEEAEWLRDA
jgi:uncharacterized 2Fe-2S/4Fe-4S cluster protein (DUF4445 family)